MSCGVPLPSAALSFALPGAALPSVPSTPPIPAIPGSLPGIPSPALSFKLPGAALPSVPSLPPAPSIPGGLPGAPSALLSFAVPGAALPSAGSPWIVVVMMSSRGSRRAEGVAPPREHVVGSRSPTTTGQKATTT